MNLIDAPAHKKFMLVRESGETAFPIMLGVPIMAHRDVLGVIAVQRVEGAFNEDEEAFLTTLAAQLANSIERAESQDRFSSEQATHMLKGVAGAPGMAIGVALVLNRGVNFESVPDKKTDDIEGELKSFREAVRKVCEELTEQANLMRASLPEEECALFLAYAQMLSGGSLIDDAEQGINAGNWAPSSTMPNRASMRATGRPRAGAKPSSSMPTCFPRWRIATWPSAPTIFVTSACACCVN